MLYTPKTTSNTCVQYKIDIIIIITYTVLFPSSHLNIVQVWKL